MAQQQKNIYASKHKPTWCPGCGNFAIWLSLQKALETLGIPPHKALIVFGIGCSGNMSNTLRTYGWHSLHGRAVPTAIGAKLANSDLTVIVTGGDGDGYGEGLGHFIHAIRGNVNITYMVHDNGVYGLTTGQAAPTAKRGFKAKSTPQGIIEEPINPIALAITSGAGFVARGFSGKADQLVNLMTAAIKHPGFALLDIFQPCITYNKINTFSYYYDKVYTLQDDPNYVVTDRMVALAKAFEQDRQPVGIFYRDTKRHMYGTDLNYLKNVPLVKKPAARRDISSLYKEFI